MNRGSFHAQQTRAERIVLAICGAMIVGAAAMGWLSGGGA